MRFYCDGLAYYPRGKKHIVLIDRQILVTVTQIEFLTNSPFFLTLKLCAAFAFKTAAQSASESEERTVMLGNLDHTITKEYTQNTPNLVFITSLLL